MAARAAALVALFAVVLFVVSAITFDGDTSSGGTNSPETPGFIYVRNSIELVVIGDSAQVPVEFDLLDALRGDASRFVESIEPIDSRQAFVGVCCEPADGRQLLVDLEDGSVEFFPFTVRFPSASLDGARYVGGGSTVTPNNLGAVLAYENGVGVVEPGPDLLVRDDGVAFRPVLLPDDRIAVVDVDGTLIVIDADGETLARSAMDLALFDFDEQNRMIVAIEDADVVLLEIDSLSEVARFTAGPASESLVVQVDVHDGWALFTLEDGSLHAAPVSTEVIESQLLATDVETAAWLR